MPSSFRNHSLSHAKPACPIVLNLHSPQYCVKSLTLAYSSLCPLSPFANPLPLWLTLLVFSSRSPQYNHCVKSLTLAYSSLCPLSHFTNPLPLCLTLLVFSSHSPQYNHRMKSSLTLACSSLCPNPLPLCLTLLVFSSHSPQYNHCVKSLTLAYSSLCPPPPPPPPPPSLSAVSSTLLRGHSHHS